MQKDLIYILRFQLALGLRQFTSMSLNESLMLEPSVFVPQ